jgi:hypothetical protein
VQSFCEQLAQQTRGAWSHESGSSVYQESQSRSPRHKSFNSKPLACSLALCYPRKSAWPKVHIPNPLACLHPPSLPQAFNWESWKHNYYKTLASQVKDIAAAGFTCVWLPPPSDSVSEQVSEQGREGVWRV